VEEIALAADVRSVGAARDFVRAQLADRQLGTFAAELLTSELTTNVVRHADTEFTVMVGVDPCVRVEVHDGVAATDAFRAIVDDPPAFVADSPGGRGLGLVARLSSRFGLADEPGVSNGKVVWFELDATEPDVLEPAEV
jgi:anti-sigma regulatory factor (Ser/Thr protein kinase)